MNKISPYEQLIADSVKQLDVPDMSDQVWANIEQMLDQPVATDPSVISGKGFRFYFYIAAALLVAVIIFILSTRQTSKPVESPDETTPPVPKEKIILPTTPDRTDSGDKIVLPVKTQTQEDLTAPKDIPRTSLPTADSINKLPMDNLRDSTPGLVPLRNAPPPLKLPVGKKPVGVPGITEDDYKIKQVKKDSGSKKDK